MSPHKRKPQVPLDFIENAVFDNTEAAKIARDKYTKDKHVWVHRPKDICTWCLTCGICRRKDGKNKPCKGAVKVELRAPVNDELFLKGYACACGVVGFINGPGAAKDLMEEGGFSIKDFQLAGANEIDINRILYGRSVR